MIQNQKNNNKELKTDIKTNILDKTKTPLKNGLFGDSFSLRRSRDKKKYHALRCLLSLKYLEISQALIALVQLKAQRPIKKTTLLIGRRQFRCPLKLKSKLPQICNVLFNENSKYFLKAQKKQKYGIIRINVGFTNLNISLTSLNGKIKSWVSGGTDHNQTKRTRMSSRAAGGLMIRFLKKFNKRTGIRFVKVLFTGPSKRFRSKFFSLIKRRSRRLKFSVLCREEGYRRSFNGCRLSRKKR